MADYWDSVNLIVHTSAPEEQNWLFQVFQNQEMPAEDWSLLPAEHRERRDPSELYTGCYAQDVSTRWAAERGVWIETDDSDTTNVDDIVLILRVFQMKFNKVEPIIVTWASHCSSPRLYSTSGGAAAIFRGEAWWFTPQVAAIEKIKQLGGTPVEQDYYVRN